MIQSFRIEFRRCFARRLVWVLLGLAVLLCAVAGVAVYVNSHPGDDPFRYHELWAPPDGSLIGATFMFLIIGAVFGGASMVGAEYRAGTITTLLTWQPRRARVAVGKILAPSVAAFGLAAILQVLFCLALLPAALARGSTDGVDASWAMALAGVIVRMAVLCGLSAGVAAAIALIGRNTAAAIGAAFVYVVIAEQALRAWKPWTVLYQLGPNGAMFVARQGIDGEFSRSALAAGLTLLAYAVVVAAGAVLVFRRRDVMGSG